MKYTTALLVTIILSVSNISGTNIIETTLEKEEFKKVKGPIEIAWILLNQFDFCILTKESTWNKSFFVAFLRQYGLDLPEFEKCMDTPRSLESRPLKKSAEVRVPRISHRVWVTDSLNPTEMLDSINDA